MMCLISMTINSDWTAVINPFVTLRKTWLGSNLSQLRACLASMKIEFNPHNPHRKTWHNGIHLQSHCQGGRDRRIPRTCRLSSLDHL